MRGRSPQLPRQPRAGVVVVGCTASAVSLLWPFCQNRSAEAKVRAVFVNQSHGQWPWQPQRSAAILGVCKKEDLENVIVGVSSSASVEAREEKIESE